MKKVYAATASIFLFGNLLASESKDKKEDWLEINLPVVSYSIENKATKKDSETVKTHNNTFQTGAGMPEVIADVGKNLRLYLYPNIYFTSSFNLMGRFGVGYRITPMLELGTKFSFSKTSGSKEETSYDNTDVTLFGTFTHQMAGNTCEFTASIRSFHEKNSYFNGLGDQVTENSGMTPEIEVAFIHPLGESFNYLGSLHISSSSDKGKDTGPTYVEGEPTSETKKTTTKATEIVISPIGFRFSF